MQLAKHQECLPHPDVTQACYRAARAAYNLKQYNKALMLAEQGIAQDAGATELKRIQQVTCLSHLFWFKVVQACHLHVSAYLVQVVLAGCPEPFAG